MYRMVLKKEKLQKLDKIHTQLETLRELFDDVTKKKLDAFSDALVNKELHKAEELVQEINLSSRDVETLSKEQKEARDTLQDTKTEL